MSMEWKKGDNAEKLKCLGDDRTNIPENIITSGLVQNTTNQTSQCSYPSESLSPDFPGLLSLLATNSLTAASGLFAILLSSTEVPDGD